MVNSGRPRRRKQPAPQSVRRFALVGQRHDSAAAPEDGALTSIALYHRIVIAARLPVTAAFRVIARIAGVSDLRVIRGVKLFLGTVGVSGARGAIGLAEQTGRRVRFAGVVFGARSHHQGAHLCANCDGSRALVGQAGWFFAGEM